MRKVKKLFAMVLAICVIASTLLISTASAAQKNGTLQGYNCVGVLNFYTSAPCGAYATTSYGTIADTIYAYVKYTYRVSGETTIKTVENSASGSSKASVSAEKRVSNSVRVSAASSHSISKNGANWGVTNSISA